jgi:hypothetical protein
MILPFSDSSPKLLPMNRWNLVIIGLLLVSCSTSSEPDPEPKDIFFDVRGGPFPYDVPEDVQIIASHPDGFADANIEVYLNDTKLFEKNEQSIGTRFDTTFTPQAQGPGQLRVEYFLQSNADVPSVQGNEIIQIQDTPFAQTVIEFYDAVTREPITGTVTDQETEKSYDIVNGEWEILRSDRIRKDVLAEGLEIAIESEGRLPTLDQAIGEEREHYQIPWSAPNFSAEEMFEFMHAFPVYMNRPDDRMTHGYPMNSTITAYIVDRSTFNYIEGDGSVRESTDNDNLYMTSTFKNNVLAMLDRFKGLIPPNNDLSLDIYVESQSDFEFPERFPEGSLTASSTPDSPFGVAQLTAQTEGVIDFTYMLQKVSPETGAVFEGSVYIACQEVVESLAALNTSDNAAILCDNDGPTPKAKPMSYASLSLPPGSSWNYTTTATGEEGTSLRPVYVVKRE